MTRPCNNATLANGQRVYLPPKAREELKALLKAGSDGLEQEIALRLVAFDLATGVKRKKWIYFITEHGKKVAQELVDQSGK